MSVCLVFFKKNFALIFHRIFFFFTFFLNIAVSYSYNHVVIADSPGGGGSLVVFFRGVWPNPLGGSAKKKAKCRRCWNCMPFSSHLRHIFPWIPGWQTPQEVGGVVTDCVLEEWKRPPDGKKKNGLIPLSRRDLAGGTGRSASSASQRWVDARDDERRPPRTTSDAVSESPSEPAISLLRVRSCCALQAG